MKLSLFSIVLTFLISPIAKADHAVCEQAKEIPVKQQEFLEAVPSAVLVNLGFRKKLAELNKSILVYDENSAKFTYTNYHIGRLSKLDVSFSVLPIGPNQNWKTEKFSVIYGEGFGTIACEIETGL